MIPARLNVWYIHPVMDTLIQSLITVGDDRFLFAPFQLEHFPDNILNYRESSILLCTPPEFAAVVEKLDGSLPLELKVILLLADESQLDPKWQALPYLHDYSVGMPSNERMLFQLNKAYALCFSESEIQRLSQQVNVQRKRLQELNEIGIALSTERKIDELLDMILYSSMEITSSDAGGLYLVEKKPDAAPTGKNLSMADQRLRFKLTRNMSIQIDFREFPMEINEKSMAGFVALSGQPLRIADAYHLPEDAPFGFNKSFDQGAGYRSKSMLTVPMKNHKNEIIGILQLINKKRNWKIPLPLTDETLLNQEIVPYEEEDENLLCSLASQAAVAIENTRLYQNIQSLFEGFIRASVQAIESRDPTTSGHSERVAALTVSLAEVVDGIEDGPYKYVKFSRDDIKEIKYASLLHDFGKIGVREHVLVKAKKLYPHELETIQQRFKLIRKGLEFEFTHQKLNYLLELAREEAMEKLSRLDQDMQDRLMEVDEYLGFVLKANEPTVLEQGGFERLMDIGAKAFDVDQESISLLLDYEIKNLSIPRGTLNNEERLEIESHVTHTYRFLSQIPWTNELKNVPDIAYAHHEKLNGSGYPRKLDEKDIPVQSKMMTISDIYDALTASDRPYKKALPVQRALDILGFEVKDGFLDKELYQLFIDSKVYEVINKIS